MYTDTLKKVSQVLDLVAQGFLYPEKDIAQAVSILNQVAHDLGIEFPDVSEQDLQELKARYTELFINAPGGVAAPPYASVYLGGAGILNQMGADLARRYYAEAGVEPTKGDAPDHVAACIAFTAFLIREGRMELLEEYLSHFLLEWFPSFADRLLAADPEGLYGALAALAQELLMGLGEELKHLRSVEQV